MLRHTQDRESSKDFTFSFPWVDSGSGIRRWLVPEGGWCQYYDLRSRLRPRSLGGSCYAVVGAVGL